MKFLRGLLLKIEQTSIGTVAGIATFLAIIFIRNQLELLLEQDHNITISLDTAAVLTDYIHVVLAWTYVYLITVIVLATVGRRPWVGAARVSLIGMTLIWIPPLVDGLTGNSGAIVYQYTFETFSSSFCGLFLPWVEVGYVTLGVRIEVFLVMITTLLYVSLLQRESTTITRATVQALACAFVIYCGIFSMGYLPAIISVISGHSHPQMLAQSVAGVSSASAPILWYLPFIIPLFLLFLSRSNGTIWRVVMSCVRIERMLIYLIFTLTGFIHASEGTLIGSDWLNFYDVIFVSLFLMCIAIAFIAVTALNDLCDLPIDLVSNPHRPLAVNPALRHEYKVVALGGSILSLAFSFAFGASQPLLLLSILSLGVLYSVPPLRLRRFLLLAPLTLTIIAMLCYMSGMALLWNNSTPEQLNLRWLFSFAILFFIACQFKDIKDVNGDRANGVHTLATLYGAKLSYQILGGALIVYFALLVAFGVLPASFLSLLAGGLFLLVWIRFKNSEWVIYTFGVSLLLLTI